MKEKILELKNKSIEKANYYSNIGFVNLANEFTSLVNILNEMESIVEECEKLKAQINNQEGENKNENL